MDAVKHNGDLREFILEGVQTNENNQVLGTGSYGTVEEVTITNTKYAAKKIHEFLLETKEGRVGDRTLDRYTQVCRLMSSIRHPNITQFIGICFIEGSHVPLIVMERLDYNLDEVLESSPGIPLHLKLMILSDVVHGLHYLHHQMSPVVHRDLIARNVLLTGSFNAKISDIGNSRLVELQLVKTLTRVPDILAYMPPEALLSSSTSCGPTLDVFSFGVVMLFTLNQVFPGNLFSPTYHDSSNTNHILARSEFERRGTYTDLLERNLVDGHLNPLFVLVRECLSNAPERRPLTSHILSTLEVMRTKIDVGILQLDIAKVNIVRYLIAKDKKMVVLQSEVATIDMSRTQRDTLLQEKDSQLQESDAQLQKDIQLQKKDAQLEALRNEIIAKDGIIAQRKLELVDKDSQLEEKDRQLAEKEKEINETREEIGHKNAELVRRATLIRQLKKQSRPELKTPLTLNWRRGKDMPFRMSGTVQSVLLGNKVFVGGGYSITGQAGCTVLSYDLQGGQWSALPLYSAHRFAMTTLDNQPVLVGGLSSGTRKATNKVSIFDSEKWVCPYPPLNIARLLSAAVSLNNHLVVAGGKDCDDHCISSVEVFDITSNRWCIADPLPFVRCSMKSVVVGNMCYLMGGVDQTGEYTKVVHCIDLEELIENAISIAMCEVSSIHSPLWHTEEDTPLFCCTPLALKGSLLAVGGHEKNKTNTSIYLYQHGTKRWVKVGDLPIARYSFTCSVLPNGEILIAGGYDRDLSYLSSVNFLTVTECS